MNLQEIRGFYLDEYAALRDRPKPAPAPEPSPLVLGLAANLNKARIEVFVNSLRRSGYQGDIVLFVTALDAETQAFCRENRVEAVRSFHTLYSPLHPTIMRFALYYDFLTSRLNAGATWDRVMLSDVTDVVFQENPFEAFAPARLAVFFEGGVRIGECPANGGWVRVAFGDEEFDKLQSERVSCSGTTMGPLADILDYLLKMMLGATNANPAALTLHGVDQGIHNYLIHNDWLPQSLHSQNGDVVLTLHYHIANGKPLAADARGRICDDAGRVIPVVHQYNRSPALTNLFRAQYAG